MKEYIEREAAKRLFLRNKSWVNFTDQERIEILKLLNSLTAADVRPVVRGKWIKYAPHNSDMMTCSECEKYWILDGDQYDYHYCPNCGAEMREES